MREGIINIPPFIVYIIERPKLADYEHILPSHNPIVGPRVIIFLLRHQQDLPPKNTNLFNYSDIIVSNGTTGNGREFISFKQVIIEIICQHSKHLPGLPQIVIVTRSADLSQFFITRWLIEEMNLNLNKALGIVNKAYETEYLKPKFVSALERIYGESCNIPKSANIQTPQQSPSPLPPQATSARQQSPLNPQNTNLHRNQPKKKTPFPDMNEINRHSVAQPISEQIHSSSQNPVSLPTSLNNPHVKSIPPAFPHHQQVDMPVYKEQDWFVMSTHSDKLIPENLPFGSIFSSKLAPDYNQKMILFTKFMHHFPFQHHEPITNIFFDNIIASVDKNVYGISPNPDGTRCLLLITNPKKYLLFSINNILEINILLPDPDSNRISLYECVLTHHFKSKDRYKLVLTDVFILNGDDTRPCKIKQRLRIIEKLLIEKSKLDSSCDDLGIDMARTYEVKEIYNFLFHKYSHFKIKGVNFIQVKNSNFSVIHCPTIYTWKFRHSNPRFVIHVNLSDHKVYGQVSENCILVNVVYIDEYRPELMQCNGIVMECEMVEDILTEEINGERFKIAKIVRKSNKPYPWTKNKFDSLPFMTKNEIENYFQRIIELSNK